MAATKTTISDSVCRNGHSNEQFFDAHNRKDCRGCSKNRVKAYELRQLYGGNREKAIQRDNGQCVKCGMTREEHKIKYGKDITVDHIDGNGINTPYPQKNNDLNNLQTLCFSCHGRKDRVKFLNRVNK